jgi:acyl carrier protein
MLQQNLASSDKLLGLVESILAKNAANGSAHSRSIPLDGDLVEIGMTSVDMVSLMLAVEAEFEVMIPTADITPQNFRSIAAIDALVARLEGTTAPASA